eukprot:3029260-Prymnesium_polylepis.1
MPWRSSKASPFASAHEMRWCVCVNGLRGRGTRTWHACEACERREWGVGVTRLTWGPVSRQRACFYLNLLYRLPGTAHAPLRHIQR